MRQKLGKLRRKKADLTRWGSLVQPQSRQPFPKLTKITKAFELPQDFVVVPAVEWKRGRCRMFQVLIPVPTKRRENVVKSRRGKKSA